MSLTVLNVAYPLAPVSPDAVGGAEQVVSMLDEGLVRAGVHSIVIACEGSRCQGTLIEVPRANPPLDHATKQRAHALHREAIASALRDYPVDVVHMHGVDFCDYLPERPPVVLATLHLPPEWYPRELFDAVHSQLYLQCVSKSQRLRCPASAASLPANPNGVRLDRLWPARRKRNFALMLGRICPEKGFDHALRAAHRADMPLWIAGELFAHPEHVRYYNHSIVPLLDARRRYLGPIGWDRKRRLLAAARCLLVPSIVPETSSLVAMEALACGTPVIAFRSGALPEIVTHGQTGWLVSDTEEMAQAMRDLDQLSPKACRREAELRFSARAMVQRYLQTYRRLCAPAKLSVSQEVRVRELTRLPELEALEAEWSALHQRCPLVTPFQSPDWLLPWCTHYAIDAVHVLAFYADKQLVGLAPLLVYRERDRRILTLLGSGVSDYQDVLFAPEHASRCSAALRQWLHSHRDLWDECNFEQLPAGSPLLTLELSLLGRSFTRVQARCPVLALSARASLSELIPARVFKNVRHAEQLLARLGDWRVLRAEPNTVKPLMAALIALHAARWTELGEPGLFEEARFAAFQREVAERFLRRGWLKLYALFLDGRPIAALDVFETDARAFYYLGGFDPKFAKSSPGAILLAHAIEAAAQSGVRSFDFLRGAESYKYRWGARDAFNQHRTVVQGSEHADATSP